MLLKLAIIEEFLKDFSVQLTGSEIARKKNLNQKTVSDYLKSLEYEHILKSRMQGRNKLYSLNFNNREITLNFIVSAEHLRTMNFLKKNLLINEVVEKIKPLIKGSAIIFGSYAKNSQKKDSDLDVLIIGKCNEKEVNNISEMYNLDISLKIFPKIENSILIREAIENHIVIKNTELFIEGLLDG